MVAKGKQQELSMIEKQLLTLRAIQKELVSGVC